MRREKKSDAPPTPGTALTVALEILSRRRKSEKELTTALARKGYPDDEIAAALVRCREFGYVDDKRYAEVLARDLSRGKKLADRAISHRLAARGLTTDVVRDAVAGMEEDVEILSEEDRAKALFKKKFPSPPATPKERDRAIRFLQARGFGWDVVSRVLQWDGTTDEE